MSAIRWDIIAITYKNNYTIVIVVLLPLIHLIMIMVRRTRKKIY